VGLCENPVILRARPGHAAILSVMQKRAMFLIKKSLAGEVASEIAEAALVLPLAFLILLGIYWFGRAFNTYATINHAAREGARAAIVNTAATLGNNGPGGAAVASVITKDMQASSVDPTKIQLYSPTYIFCSGQALTNCNSYSKITVCTAVQLQNPPANSTGLGAQACGVGISFQYPYQFWLPFTSLNNQQITLTANVQMAEEY
jgi:Flp pilus assembly protein TadG